MENLVASLRYATRSLLRHRTVSLLAILCMGLGIGTCVTLFTAANPWLFRPLPYPGPGSVGVPATDLAGSGGGEWSGEPPLGARLSRLGGAGPLLQGWAASSGSSINLSTEGEPERVPAARVTATLFPTLGITPVLGRSFRPEEDRKGAGVAVIGHDLWRRRFGGDPQVVGRTLRLDGTLHPSSGVMPERSRSRSTPRCGRRSASRRGATTGATTASTWWHASPGATWRRPRPKSSPWPRPRARAPGHERGAIGLVRPYLEVLTPPGVVTGLYLVLGAAFFVLLIAARTWPTSSS